MIRYLSTAEVAALAASLHAGQVDKAGRPYVLHLSAVASRVGTFQGDIQSAWLHDSLEDTGCTTRDLLRAGVNPSVVESVEALTRRPGEPYLDAVRRAYAHPLARPIKLADNADNADPERLALLDEATRARLTRKYALARAILEGKAHL